MLKKMAAVAAAMIAAGPGMAVTMTTMQSYGFASGSNTVAVARFDPSLGTLTAVEIKFGLSYSLTFSVNATSSGFATATLSSPTDVVFSGAPDGQAYTLHEGGNAGGQAYSACNGCYYSGNAGIATTKVYSDLSDFVGTSPFTVSYAAPASPSFTVALSGSGSGTAQSSSILGASVRTTYTYLVASPVPQPATWAMMLAGFGMLGAVLRRSERIAVRA